MNKDPRGERIYSEFEFSDRERQQKMALATVTFGFIVLIFILAAPFMVLGALQEGGGIGNGLVFLGFGFLFVALFVFILTEMRLSMEQKAALVLHSKGILLPEPFLPLSRSFVPWENVKRFFVYARSVPDFSDNSLLLGWIFALIGRLSRDGPFFAGLKETGLVVETAQGKLFRFRGRSFRRVKELVFLLEDHYPDKFRVSFVERDQWHLPGLLLLGTSLLGFVFVGLILSGLYWSTLSGVCFILFYLAPFLLFSVLLLLAGIGAILCHRDQQKLHAEMEREIQEKGIPVLEYLEEHNS